MPATLTSCFHFHANTWYLLECLFELRDSHFLSCVVVISTAPPPRPLLWRHRTVMPLDSRLLSLNPVFFMVDLFPCANWQERGKFGIVLGVFFSTHPALLTPPALPPCSLYKTSDKFPARIRIKRRVPPHSRRRGASRAGKLIIAGRRSYAAIPIDVRVLFLHFFRHLAARKRGLEDYLRRRVRDVAFRSEKKLEKRG